MYVYLKERFVKYGQNFKPNKSSVSSLTHGKKTIYSNAVRQNKLSSGLPCSLSGCQEQFAWSDDLGPGPDRLQGDWLHSELNHELIG